MTPQNAAMMPAAGSRIQNDQPEIGAEQRIGIGADRVEGDVAEVEQAGEADDDVQPPGQHHVDQDLDAEIVDPLQRALQADQQNDDDRDRGTAPSRPRSAASSCGSAPCSAATAGALALGRGSRAANRRRDEADIDEAAGHRRSPRRWPAGPSAGTRISSLRDVLIGLQADEQHEQAEGDQRRRRAPRAARAGSDVGGGVAAWRHACAMAQTFSTSGRPRMPDGRKISTIARMEKAATSL